MIDINTFLLYNLSDKPSLSYLPNSEIVWLLLQLAQLQQCRNNVFSFVTCKSKVYAVCVWFLFQAGVLQGFTHNIGCSIYFCESIC